MAKIRPTTKITPRKSVKIDGKLYVGGTEYEVTDDVRKKIQDVDAATIREPGESTVRTMLDDAAQAGSPREFVKGGTDGAPYSPTEETQESEENPDEDMEEVEEEVEEPDPEEPTRTRKAKKKVKRAKRR